MIEGVVQVFMGRGLGCTDSGFGFLDLQLWAV